MNRTPLRMAQRESFWVRALLILIAVTFLSLFVLLPLSAVFYEALSKGVGPYLDALSNPETLAAVRLTLLVAGIAVPLNLVFGIAAAWLLAKHEFVGRGLLSTIIDLPFAVSPVVAGLVLVLVFGRTGLLGEFFSSQGIQIIFALPGLVLATTFITLPFIVREIVPLLESQQSDQETAAMTLGASGMQTFFLVTLPRIKWALLYGVVL